MNSPLISTISVAWMGFALGAVFGFVANKTNFCTMGAISDIVNMDDWTRLRQWLLAIAVTLLGVALLQGTGLVDVRKSMYTGTRLTWLSNIVGGLLFGVGMVLASGCGSKTLIRVGGGNLKSILVLLVLAISAFATMRGLFAVWRTDTVDQLAVNFSTAQDLPSLLAGATGLAPAMLSVVLPVLIALALMVYVFKSPEARNVDTVLGGLVIGLVIAGGWYVTGSVAHVAEHPDTLQEAYIGTFSNRPESLSLVAPTAYGLELLLFWSDKSKYMQFGVASALGIIAGSAAWAILSKRYHEEVFPTPADFKRHMLGGALMGIGGVTGLGCTIGQGLTGLSTLSVGSMLTVAGIVVGATAMIKYDYWRIMNEA